MGIIRAVSRSSLVLLAALASGCADPASESTDDLPGPPRAELDIQCLPGCTETDPYPDSAGAFLSSAVSPETCFYASGTDADGDRLVDRCERDLAQRFAPQLYYYRYDDVRREPYWVAGMNSPQYTNVRANTPIYPGGGQVRIVYLLSYYEDLGGQTFSCTIPGAHLICLPHHGDSEWILLDLWYNERTQHWLLKGILMSQHTYAEGYSTLPGKTYTTRIAYPEKAGTYPRVWVAQGKHANYPNKASCDEGGTFDSDTCEKNNTGARVEYSGAYNLGSRPARLRDCVQSRNPSWQFYGTGKQECYWRAGDTFRAWYPDNIGGGESGVHADILASLGF